MSTSDEFPALEQEEYDRMPQEEFEARDSRIADLLQSHPGRAAHQRWDSLGLVHAAVRLNEQSLLSHVDFQGERGAIRAQAVGRTEDSIRQFWLLLFLHLTNYLAMNSTLVDHVRKLMGEYNGTQFEARERERRTTFAESGVSAFLGDLRNFILHGSTPPMSFQTRVTPAEGEVHTARLDAQPLLDSGQFSVGARSYLGGLDSVSIVDAVAAFASFQHDYYQWLFAEFDGLHAEDVEDYNRLVAEYRRMHGRPSA